MKKGCIVVCKWCLSSPVNQLSSTAQPPLPLVPIKALLTPCPCLYPSKLYLMTITMRIVWMWCGFCLDFQDRIWIWCTELTTISMQYAKLKDQHEVRKSWPSLVKRQRAPAPTACEVNPSRSQSQSQQYQMNKTGTDVDVNPVLHIPRSRIKTLYSLGQ